ncbi:hypothetical protein YB2330_004675 [Saitoella coloradoensis]
MEYTYLGKSGLKVSKIILGCMGFGSSKWQDWVLDEKEALPLLKYAYDKGITTWDTANTYSNGESERIIGKAIKQYNLPRDSLVIMTKCYFPVSKEDVSQNVMSGGVDPDQLGLINQYGLSRKAIFAAVDASLKRMGTDYIDLLQIHRRDPNTPIEETMEALHDLVKSGKVHYIGASSMYAWEFLQMQQVAEKNGWTKFVSMQNFYNLLYREEEREMIPMCRVTGVGVVNWSPIARGFLARPPSATTTRTETDPTMRILVDPETKKLRNSDAETVRRVQELARKKDVSMAQIATAWNLSKEGVTAPIVGVKKESQIDDALGALSVKLSEEDKAYLEECYQPKNVVGHK